MTDHPKIGALYKCNPCFGYAEQDGHIMGIPGGIIVMLLNWEDYSDTTHYTYMRATLLVQEKIRCLLYSSEDDFLQEFVPVC